MALPQFPSTPVGLRSALVWAADRSNADSADAEADRVILRLATAADVPTIHGLVKELAEFEREPDAVVTTIDTFLRDGFPEGPDATPLFHVLLASLGEGGSVGGMAFVYQSYSTWTGPCIYLEDLYVTPAARRRGISRVLFKALAGAAHVTGCGRLHWSVLKWNTPALGLCELSVTQLPCTMANASLLSMFVYTGVQTSRPTLQRSTLRSGRATD